MRGLYGPLEVVIHYTEAHDTSDILLAFPNGINNKKYIKKNTNFIFESSYVLNLLYKSTWVGGDCSDKIDVETAYLDRNFLQELGIGSRHSMCSKKLGQPQNLRKTMR